MSKDIVFSRASWIPCSSHIMPSSQPKSPAAVVGQVMDFGKCEAFDRAERDALDGMDGQGDVFVGVGDLVPCIGINRDLKIDAMRRISELSGPATQGEVVPPRSHHVKDNGSTLGKLLDVLHETTYMSKSVMVESMGSVDDLPFTEDAKVATLEDGDLDAHLGNVIRSNVGAAVEVVDEVLERKWGTANECNVLQGPDSFAEKLRAEAAEFDVVEKSEQSIAARSVDNDRLGVVRGCGPASLDVFVEDVNDLLFLNGVEEGTPYLVADIDRLFAYSFDDAALLFDKGRRLSKVS